MPESSTPEAQPVTNTAKPLNPLRFDEDRLGSLLNELQESQKPKANQAEAEAPAEPAPEKVEEAAEAEATESEQDNSDEQPESVDSDPSQVEEEQKPEPEESKGVQKRIDKLTAKAKQAQEQAEALQRELDEAKAKLEQLESQEPVQQVRNPENPFAEIWDDGKLKTEYEKARDLRRWCEDNASGTELNGKEYTAEDVKMIRRKVEDAMELHLPARAAFLNQFRAAKPVAEQLYPFWKDRRSQEYVEAQAVLRAMPGLANIPEHQILVGDFLRGRKARLEALQKPKATTPKVATKPAPKQPSAPVSQPVRSQDGEAARSVSKQKFFKTGDPESLAELLKGF